MKLDWGPTALYGLASSGFFLILFFLAAAYSPYWFNKFIFSPVTFFFYCGNRNLKNIVFQSNNCGLVSAFLYATGLLSHS